LSWHLVQLTFRRLEFDMLAAHRAPKGWQIHLVPACLAAAAVLGGCGPQSSQQRFDEAAKQIPGFQKSSVARFGGKVLIDGQPPGEDKDKKVFVVLKDPAHPAEKGKKAVCNPDGSFDFMTYFPHDGVPAGKYIVTIVQFGRMKTGRSFGGGGLGPAALFGGADGLKGLYSDPDHNAKDDKFVVNVEPPGKSDYEFDLAVAGKDQREPGPNATRMIRN
jgi:hypothetical protein